MQGLLPWRRPIPPPLEAVVSFTEAMGAESASAGAKSVRVEQYFHAFRASDGTAWVGGYVVGTDESASEAVQSYLTAEIALVSGAIDDFESALPLASGPQATDLEPNSRTYTRDWTN
jgi:hypothetical protein